MKKKQEPRFNMAVGILTTVVCLTFTGCGACSVFSVQTASELGDYARASEMAKVVAMLGIVISIGAAGIAARAARGED